MVEKTTTNICFKIKLLSTKQRLFYSCFPLNLSSYQHLSINYFFPLLSYPQVVNNFIKSFLNNLSMKNITSFV